MSMDIVYLFGSVFVEYFEVPYAGEEVHLSALEHERPHNVEDSLLSLARFDIDY